jgi:tRNA(adenine34) deaminase
LPFTVLPFRLAFPFVHRYILTVKNEDYMELCLKEARKAYDEDEVPVGALIVSPEGRIISEAHNRTRRANSPLAHAEILAVQQACEARGNFRLTGCTLFVSKEPCIMCAGAVLEARVERVVFGCYDKKRGAFGSAGDVRKLPSNHKVEVEGGVLKERSEGLLKQFFQERRGA